MEIGVQVEGRTGKNLEAKNMVCLRNREVIMAGAQTAMSKHQPCADDNMSII